MKLVKWNDHRRVKYQEEAHKKVAVMRTKKNKNGNVKKAMKTGNS